MLYPVTAAIALGNACVRRDTLDDVLQLIDEGPCDSCSNQLDGSDRDPGACAYCDRPEWPMYSQFAVPEDEVPDAS